MALKILETRWKLALNSILEQLSEQQRSKLLFNLGRIPQGLKKDRSMEDISLLIVQYYGAEASITVIDREMKKLPRNDADVQELLRPFVEKLKRSRQKSKERPRPVKAEPEAGTSKGAAASGSAAKRPKPAADQLKSCRPKKIKAVGAVKPKKKKPDSSLKPAGSSQTSECAAMTPVGAMKPKKKKHKKKKSDSSLKPAGSSQTSEINAVGAVKPKKKKPDSSLKPAGSSQTSEINAVGAVKPKKEKPASSLKPAGSSQTSEINAVGAVKPKKEKPASSLKPAGSSQTSKVQSAPVQTGKIQILRIKTSNKTNTHLEVEFNDRPQAVFVTTRLLANAFGLGVEEDFTDRLLSLTAVAQIQGNKILFIQKM